MTTMSAPPVKFDRLTDAELEGELTLAALTSRREARFNVLLRERLRRRRQPVAEPESIVRRVARSFVTRTDAD